MAKYTEIRELFEYCRAIGVKATLAPYSDGFVIHFIKGDFAQHSGTKGGRYGLLEPFIRCKFDLQGVTLEDAKRLVKQYKNELNGKKKEKENGK